MRRISVRPRASVVGCGSSAEPSSANGATLLDVGRADDRLAMDEQPMQRRARERHVAVEKQQVIATELARAQAAPLFQAASRSLRATQISTTSALARGSSQAQL